LASQPPPETLSARGNSKETVSKLETQVAEFEAQITKLRAEVKLVEQEKLQEVEEVAD